MAISALLVHWPAVTRAARQLLSLPLTDIACAWLEGHPLTLVAGVDIQPWLGAAHDADATFASVRKWLGDTIMRIARLHALAALFHHVVLRDEVLSTVLPRWFLKLIIIGRPRGLSMIINFFEGCSETQQDLVAVRRPTDGGQQDCTIDVQCFEV